MAGFTAVLREMGYRVSAVPQMAGIWEKLLEILVDEPDFEWLMIDVSHCKVHPHAAGARGGNQDMSRTKGGSIPRFTLPWMQMVCRSEYLSQRVPELIAKKLFT